MRPSSVADAFEEKMVYWRKGESSFNRHMTWKYPFGFLTEFGKFSSSGVICQIKLEVLILSVYTQIQLLYLNEAVDKVLIIAEIHVMLKKTKTRHTFDALYHFRPGLRDPTTDPAGDLQQVVKLLLAKQGSFVLFWPLRLWWHPEDLRTIESLCCGATDCRKRDCLLQQRYIMGRGKEASFKRIGEWR